METSTWKYKKELRSFQKITLAKYQTLVLSVEEWRVTETNLQLHRWLLWLRRKTEVWWLLLDQQKLVILLLFPLVPFYFSVSDSCSILSSSSSSCFLIFSSAAWACAESSMARRRSVSGLEADMELEGLEVSPYSTSAPSGMLLEWRVGKNISSNTIKKKLLKKKTTSFLSPPPVTLASGHDISIRILPDHFLQGHKWQQYCRSKQHTEHRWWKQRVFWPGWGLYETPGGFDGWRTAAAPHRYWTRARDDCRLVGGNCGAPRTPKGTPEMKTILTGQTKTSC